MTVVGWLPAPAEELFGPQATAEESYEVLTVDVPPSSWIAALQAARDRLGCTYFDWLSAVDEPGTGFRVSAHVVALSPVRRLLVRTTVPHEAPALPTAVDVYAGAAWHERETHEMFGVAFDGHPSLDHLLLPEGFEGHPLRKDFVLAARVAKAWPGAKEPGESEHGGPKRRQMLPPGVPDPNEWGPLKGQLPSAPARPARGAGRTPGERPTRPAGERPQRGARERGVGERAVGERPARRSRTAAEGSASQAAGTAEGPAGPASMSGSAGTPVAPRRSRRAAEGSVNQTEATRPTDTSGTDTSGTGKPTPKGTSAPAADVLPTEAPVARRRARTASGGSASQRATPGTAASADGVDEAATPPQADGTPPKATTPRSPDAPWHHARPAFDQPETERGTEPEPRTGTGAGTEAGAETVTGTGTRTGTASEAEAEQTPPAEPAPEAEAEQAAEAESDTEAGAEAGAEAEAKQAPTAKPDPEAEARPEPAAGSEAEADPKPGPDRPTPAAAPTPENPAGGPR